MLKFDVPDLYVKDYSNDFKKRQGSLFDALEAAEKEHSEIIPKVKNKPARSAHNYNQRSLTKSYRGKKSIFKIPEVPLSRLKTKKQCGESRKGWTKYTLSDVSADDMSEGTMAKAAFSFWREQQDRKIAAAREDYPADYKPVFKKPQMKKEDENATTTKNEKEYNFGEKPQKPAVQRITKVVAITTIKNVKLNHLQFEEDDDE